MFTMSLRSKAADALAAPPSSQHCEDCILSLLLARGQGKSICPSEVARTLDPDGWKSMMPVVREAASALARSGVIEITQQDRVLSPEERMRGPIRLRFPDDSPQLAGKRSTSR